jgi:hypothetical protein
MSKLVEKQEDPVPRWPTPKLPQDASIRRELLHAYKVLRLDHQIEFAAYKLSEDDVTFLGLSSKALRAATDVLASFTLVAAILTSAVSAILGLIEAPVQPWHAWLPLASTLLVLAGVSVRVWRDGLALGEERERYEEMQHRLLLLNERWTHAASDEERFAVAADLEQAALEELRSFIRAHRQAQFVV